MTDLTGLGGLKDSLIYQYAKDAGFSTASSITISGKQYSPAIIAVAIASAESNMNPSAIGGPNSDGSRDYGLWQINDKAHPDILTSAVMSSKSWADPQTNAKMAYQVYHNAGDSFTPWSTYNNGTYLKKLPSVMLGQVQIEGVTLNPVSALKNGLTNPLSGWVSDLTGWLGGEIRVIGFFFAAVILIVFALYLIVKPAFKDMPIPVPA